MERFAFPSIRDVGRKKKLDVTKICRCCGLEQGDEMYPILMNSEFGVEFHLKVSRLLGIHVKKTDKMPQLMCMICMDKINDFYEFYEMSVHADEQIRQALGLPPADALPKQQIKPEVKQEDTPTSSRKRNQKAATAPQPLQKKSKKSLSCKICKDSQFDYQNDLNDHLRTVHQITYAKYACGSCRETFEQLSENKAHDTWHTRQKLPYTCFICLSEFTKPKEFNKHMTNYNCPEKEKLRLTVEDIKCFQCKKKFLTQSLFEWHGCFLKAKGNCAKCGQYFTKKKLMFKHYVTCDGLFQAPASALDPIKSEDINARLPINVSGAQTKGLKKKIVPNRKVPTDPIEESEYQNSDGADGDDYSNYDDITYDNFGNDSDSNEAPAHTLEPVVELQYQNSVRIKAEKSNDSSVIKQFSAFARNIKKEKESHSSAVIQQQNNSFMLKIKSERGANGQTVQYLNPMAIRSKTSETASKQVFKFPNKLRMKIKLEKKDAGYGDDLEEQRDEAEPEDEDLMGDTSETFIAKIKKEKIDRVVVEPRDSAKQFINPMALIRREKSNNETAENNSLVISAVTSINLHPPENTNEAQGAMKYDDAKNSLETPNTNGEASLDRRCENTAMVQIPLEFRQPSGSQSLPSVDESIATEPESNGSQ